ncbi:hypothetical protein BJ322DRAFT_1035700 [Thelephora terrestris]|uniref:BRCT domain-containing protein n=1 Tax=Thelephora terrestris TaxID=56493 RepID=A0A9P6HLT1_9AGAM|nr:hypothetical protein BJ322DRAFT_1035700 [Thelephora terrestris]
MNARRRNKSHKVPNVKLRPAQPSSSASSKRSSDRSHQPSSGLRNLIRHSSPDNEPENTFVDLCPRPFKGVVLCATGIQDKTALFKIALELGAEHRKDLTVDTTHLIADEHGGAKYHCALQMKIPILRSTWVTECHAIWKQGDDVDLRESVTSHRLPIFSELVIALSGVDDANRQKQINQLITYNEGIFAENIERPVKVTHLLCSGDEKTENMKYAEKFNNLGEANIKLVWEEWFWDCIHFGGRWPEDNYLVTNPRPEQKQATPPPRSSSPVPQDNSPNTTPLPSSSPQLTHPPTIDPEEEEIASVRKRVPHETLRLWENLLGPRGFGVVDGKLKRTPSESRAPESCEQVPLSPIKPKTQLVNAADNGSLLSNFKRTNSFAIKPKEESRRQPFTKGAITGTSGTLPTLPQRAAEHPIASSSKLHAEQGRKEGIFAGKKLRALGEANTANVRSVVEGKDGFWIVDDVEDVDFLIVRLAGGSALHGAERKEKEKPEYRTECWLEKCIFEDRICDPDEHITFRPIVIPTPVPGAAGMVISFSGLGESEACWTRRFIRGIGASHAPTFSKKTTHLLCPSRQGPKAEKAVEWGISIVDTSWLGSLLVSTTDSPVTEDRVNLLPPLCEGREELVEEIDPVPNPGSKPDAGNSAGTESDTQETFPPADNSIPQELEFHTINFLGRSTPKKNRLKSGLLPGGDTESSSLHLFSTSTPIEGWEPVPSSRSPSPMVLKKSPKKVEEREQRAHQVIAESITTLLGKRQASKEEIVTTTNSGRVTKRSRPLSRNKSLNKEKERAAEEVEVDSFVFGTPKNGVVFRPVPLEPGAEDGDRSLVQEPLEDDGMRVTYEDPRQREERQRLASILGGREESILEPRGRRRRSARLAGS